MLFVTLVPPLILERDKTRINVHFKVDLSEPMASMRQSEETTEVVSDKSRTDPDKSRQVRTGHGHAAKTSRDRS